MSIAAKLQIPDAIFELMTILLTGSSAYTIKPFFCALDRLINNAVDLTHHV